MHQHHRPDHWSVMFLVAVLLEFALQIVLSCRALVVPAKSAVSVADQAPALIHPVVLQRHLALDLRSKDYHQICAGEHSSCLIAA